MDMNINKFGILRISGSSIPFNAHSRIINNNITTLCFLKSIKLLIGNQLNAFKGRLNFFISLSYYVPLGLLYGGKIAETGRLDLKTAQKCKFVFFLGLGNFQAKHLEIFILWGWRALNRELQAVKNGQVRKNWSVNVNTINTKKGHGHTNE